MRCRPPVFTVIGSSLMSSAKLFVIVPYQKRPWRSHLPSLERFFGLSLSGATNRRARPVSGSKKSIPLCEAMMRPPARLTAIAVTISGMRQLACSPVLGCQRFTVFDGTSLQ
jgi:hypothetical protein